MSETGAENASFDEVQALLDRHADAVAARAVAKLGGPLTPENLEQFLGDQDCLRCPTRIAYSSEGLEPHQFAEPIMSAENGVRHCALHVHPRYADQAEALPYFVAYMAAAINYGGAASAELCERYGAALLGLTVDVFYERVCAFAGDLPVIGDNPSPSE
jgi:hypothetical protein